MAISRLRFVCVFARVCAHSCAGRMRRIWRRGGKPPSLWSDGHEGSAQPHPHPQWAGNSSSLQETSLSFIPHPSVTLHQWRLMADGSDIVCPAWKSLLSPIFNKGRAPLEELRSFCPSAAPSPQHYSPSLINSEGWHCLSWLVFALNFIEMGHWKLITSCLDSDFDFCSAASKINSSWR